MLRSYKYRLYPSKKQNSVLQFTLDHCRYLYNTALQQRIDAYKSVQYSVSCYEQMKELPLLKIDFPEYKQIYGQVLQDVLSRLDKAYKNFFRRVKQKNDKAGFPRFKAKNRYNSFTYIQNGFRICQNSRIELSKIEIVKVKFHRNIPDSAKIKTCTIKREGEKWYVIFSCELSCPIPKKKAVTNAVGIDFGLTDFAVLSNGEEIKNPKYLKQSETKLKTIQSKYSKGKSKKLKRQLSNLHHKIANQRKDFQHKLSRKLVNNYDLIAHEDLNIKQMIEDNKYNLQKHISDAAWRQFISMITYKAEDAGKYCIAVNPRGTTQRCNRCGAIVKKDLYERTHSCPVCGYVTTRDHNSAQEVLRLGMSQMDDVLVLPSYSSLKPAYFNGG